MIPFSQLRTGRLVVDLKEISITDSMRIAAYPEGSEEQSATQFLRAIFKQSDIDPLEMTVGERTYAVTFYLGHLSEDGADFRIGDGTVSDYIFYNKEYRKAPLIESEVAGDTWKAIHLTGKFSESIERLVGHLDIPIGLHWQAGLIAAQLRNQSDPEEISATSLDDWMLDRMKVVLAYPDSDFHALYDFLETANNKLLHLFDFAPSLVDGGLIYYPSDNGGESKDLPPATFPCLSCLSERSKALYGLFSQSSG